VEVPGVQDLDSGSQKVRGQAEHEAVRWGLGVFGWRGVMFRLSHPLRSHNRSIVAAELV
jgi:hypothetical protein